MRSKALGIGCVMLYLAASSGRSPAQDRAVTTIKGDADHAVQVDSAVVESDESAAPIQLVPIPAGTAFLRHTVAVGGGDVTAGADDQLIFSNTLGSFGAALGAGRLVSDDITTVVPNNCKLRRYEFPVMGKVDPNGLGGPYTVDYVLYSTCPLSLPSASRAGVEIAGTRGRAEFLDDAPRLITFVAGANVPLPTNFWFGVQFDRGNAGPVVGAPPLSGFSCDQFDFPQFPCGANLGGFPDDPQASFNLEIYSDSTCTNTFTGYKNHKPGNSTFNPGTSVYFADDIQLGGTACSLVGYDVTLKGVGFYEFDLRNNCDGGVIAGTQKNFTIGSGTDTRIARFNFAQPIALPQNLWFSARVNNSTGGVVVTGRQACIGRSEDLVGVIGEDQQCTIIDVPGQGVHAALDVTITCAGAAPVGACCDMNITQCNGGPNDGAVCSGKCSNSVNTGCTLNSDCLEGGTCASNIDCNLCSGGSLDGSPCDSLIPAAQNPCILGGGSCPVQGTCDSICREVPQTNCSFPPRFTILRPSWLQGAVCTPDPFVAPFGQVCGVAACCYGDQGGDQCDELTEADCNQAGDLTKPRQWQPGRYCNYPQGQRCPRIACLARTGECSQARCTPACEGNPPCVVSPTCCDSCPPVGCDNAECCTIICDADPFCCETEWDSPCADRARDDCDVPPANDVCAPDESLEGARTITDNPPSSVESDSGRATASPDDPVFGCYVDNPGTAGLQTVWYKFVATDTSALVQTCNSNSPADDSLVSVFAVGNPSDETTQCSSLIPLACSDDSPPDCCDTGNCSKICAKPLIPGNLYYIMVASKNLLSAGRAYRLNLSSVCSNPAAAPGDFCPAALTAFDGTTEYDLGNMSLDPPAEDCMDRATNDMWFNYTATCSGLLTVQTCGDTRDTNLALYDGNVCPPIAGAPLACNANFGGTCGLGAKLADVDVIEGNAYKIRLADTAENRPAGNLQIACVQSDCPAGQFVFTDPPNPVLDAARPHLPDAPAQLQGIKIIKGTGPRDALSSCFSLCETTNSGNFIESIVEDPTENYTITLSKPIAAGAMTTITYRDTHGLKSSGRFTSHPGNVSGDATTSSTDDITGLNGLIALLDAPAPPACGNYCADINRSGRITPADLLEEVDLMTNGGPYDPPAGGWDGSQNQSTNPACPVP